MQQNHCTSKIFITTVRFSDLFKYKRGQGWNQIENFSIRVPVSNVSCKIIIYSKS